MKKFIKKLSVTFLAIMVVLNSFSVPGVSAIFAGEGETTTTAIEQSTDGTVENPTDSVTTEDGSQYNIEGEPSADQNTETEEPGNLIDSQGTSGGEIPVEELTGQVTEQGETTETQIPEQPEVTEETPSEEDASEGKASDDTETTEETTAEAEEVSVSMPAKTFYDVVNGVSIKVEADEGTFPEGTFMKSKGVDASAINDKVNNAMAENVTVVKAVDITFFDKDSKEIQPAKEVKVTLNAVGVTQTEDTNIVHIDEQGSVEVMQDVDSNGTESKFAAEHFSVYAVVVTVVPRLTVTFKNGDTDLETMYVKASDTASEVETILFDPGAGSVPSGQIFKGWTTDPNYTAETPLMSIAQVRQDAMTRAAALETQDGAVTYYAAIFKQYTVTYIDEKGVSLGSNTVEIPARETEGTYTVNMFYAVDDVHNLEGWIVADGDDNIKGYPSNAESETLEDGTTQYYYPNNTEITIFGDVTFSVDAPAGHWLVFDENGKGATYNAPQFIKAGETTTAPSIEMQRNGYNFDNWYTGAPSTTGGDPTGSVFSFGGTLTSNTTIYAKWIPISTANYTIIIWKQNVDGNGYDFEESISLTGSVNTTVNTVSAHGTGNNRYARVDRDNKQYTGFHLKEFDQNVTIVPEGNAVVNIYYDRNEYTLTFQTEGYTYTPTTEDGGTQYGLVNGEYVQLTRHNNGPWWNPNYYWTYGNNNRYNGTRYTRSFGWQTIKTITGLYQQSIGDNFPITDHGADSEWRWEPQNSSTFSEVLVYIDLMPAENVTFHSNEGQAETKYMEFYVEALPGQTPDRTWNGKSFVKYGNTIPAKYGFFTEAEDFVSLTGYTKFGSDPAFVNGRADVDDGGTLRLYYTREAFKLNFMDGVYIDGSDKPVPGESSRGQLKEVDNLAYGTDLSSYNKSGTNYFAPTYDGFVFEGWYIDDASTQPYTFTTMPSGGLTIYAKWRQIQYRVFMHPNAGTDSTLTWGSENQQMNFRVSYGEKVSTPTGQRTGFEFFGWYTDPEMTHAFANATVLNEATVSTAYDKSDPANYTEGMDKWGNNATSNGDVDRSWITKKLDLYAKWSAIIVGAEGIGVIYDANGGTNAPSDTALYKDSANVTAGAASKAPASTAGEPAKQFSHWVVQSWNGTAYVDTAITVLPGETFVIKKSDAKITDRATGNLVNPDDVVSTGHYNYTVQLKAIYTDVEEETPTHIDWYSNYGGENDGKGALLRSDTDIKINQAVDILAAPTRTGYKFLGWTKIQGGTTADFLVWDSANSKYTTSINGTTYDVTQVAADEKEPIEELFAVWQAELTVEISGNTATKEYNGGEQNVTGYTVKYYVGGEEITAEAAAAAGVSVNLVEGETAEAKGTAVNTYDMDLTFADFTVNPGNYYYDATNEANTYTDGWLVISPAEVTLTANSDTTIVYDGNEHQVTGYTSSVTGLEFEGVSAA
ncbi:MAG: InlB B-repeat-containing protein, partial [Aeriscardovia sp.]|nr:InlB B-repeat-containing protein [Aeriscardovia sp.]